MLAERWIKHFSIPTSFLKSSQALIPALLTNLSQEATQAKLALMTDDQRGLIYRFLDARALPDKAGYEFVETKNDEDLSL